MNIPQQIIGQQKTTGEIALRDVCSEYLIWLASSDFYEDGIEDYETTIMERALEYVFGKQVWDYINHYYK